MNVFILATCVKPELWPYTALVFKTLRVGFPTATVTVYLNGKDPKLDELESDDVMTKRVDTIHHEWIEGLVLEQTAPFYIVDTDMIFYGNFEQWAFDRAMAGWRIPQWQDQFSGAVTRPRLHTSLLYIDPVKVRAKIEEFWTKVPITPFTPRANLFHPLVAPLGGQAYFYDTCSLLYNAIGGEAFGPQQKNCYFHFNFGTISHLVLPRLKEEGLLQKAREEVLAEPALGIARWREQEQWYESKQF
jgi:hypothetical protein